MKIGIAIPCYCNHINYVFQLLDSIEKQSILPDKVAISCSSTDTFPQYRNKYSFPIEVIITNEYKNTAQNRNIAASLLRDMDYITFFDADDIMHPKRTEVIIKSITNNENVDIIIHGFGTSNRFYSYNQYSFENIDMNTVEIRPDMLDVCYTGCATYAVKYDHFGEMHQAHVTVKSSILDKIKFSEKQEDVIKADSIFCYNVLSMPDIKNVFINQKLSLYVPSGTCL